MDYVLALDIGTGSARAALFDVSGHLAGPIGSADYGQSEEALPPEWAETDASRWLCAARSAIREAIGGTDGERICAIGVSGLFPAMVAFDDTGRPVRPALLYSDRRSQAQLARIRAQGLGGVMEDLSGSALTTGTTSVTSLLWCRDEEPDIFSRIVKFTHVNGLVGHWLTGEFGMDRSNAALTGLFDTRLGRWSESMCSALGIDLSLLPRIMEGADPIGILLPRIADELGLPPGIPVAMGGGDTVCAALGSGCTGPGDFVISSGTTDTLALCVDQYVFDPVLYCVGHVAPNRFLSIGPMSCTGGCLEWYARNFAAEERLAAESRGLDVYRVLEDAAGAVAPGSGGVLFLPYLRGERTPINDPNARAVAFGMTDATTSAAMARAIMEGVAFGIRHCLTAMERAHGLTVENLTIVGKPGVSDLWNQIKADVAGRPLVALGFEERSLLGAAALGLLAAQRLPADLDSDGRVRGVMEFIAHHSASRRTYDPRPELRGLYDHQFGLYTDLYEALSDRGLFVRAGATHSMS